MTDNDYEDIVDYGLDDPSLDHQMESVSGMKPTDDDDADDVQIPTVLAQLPTDNELQLAQRVLDLERERDAFAAQVKELQARYPAHSTTIAAPSTEDEPPTIHVPHELVPVFAVLRQHIHELTRENAALRYTLLGTSARPDIATSSRVTLDAVVSPASSMATTPLPTESPPIGIEVTPPTDSAAQLPNPPPVPRPGPIEPDVDLAAVVARVKTLMLENDELGDMVAEAGRADGEEWAKTLDDSKAIIASLDSDLSHNLTVIESLRAELDAYKSRPSPLDSSRASVPPAASAPQLERQQRDRERGGGGDRDRPAPDRGGDRGGGGRDRNDRRRNGGGGGGGPPDDRDRERDRDRDRDRYRPERPRDPTRERDNRQSKWGNDTRRDKDERDRSGGGGGGGGRRDEKPSAGPGGGGGGGGLSILGRATAENGSSRRAEDDRAK
ncbi:uncharacterized protein EHS24_005449 [Apiotrichum porosum]|uniref:Uncharacterized protein n=1 Tax=Apiotrichum porosum TaxID=105984 RepID=A0A427XCS5_9TREE|nr:uncharacterized protein EHS24_005449 [Apiotrichum porosum]RSH76701.1 hypothetical protein EHS24_005449 [Apiotrichum porosum]